MTTGLVVVVIVAFSSVIVVAATAVATLGEVSAAVAVATTFEVVLAADSTGVVAGGPARLPLMKTTRTAAYLWAR